MNDRNELCQKHSWVLKQMPLSEVLKDSMGQQWEQLFLIAMQRRCTGEKQEK